MHSEKLVFTETGEEIIELRPEDAGRFVWEEKVIQHRFKLLPPAFHISEDEDGKYDIEIFNHESKFFCYLINASRMFWREAAQVCKVRDTALSFSCSASMISVWLF